MIQTLVKGGVSIDQANLDAVTPLMHAAESCKATSVKALLALGADRNLKDHQGKTAAQLIPIGHDDLADRCRATAYMFQR